VSSNLNLRFQPNWSLNGTWQKESREQDQRLRVEIEEMTLQVQQAVHLFFDLLIDVGIFLMF